MKCNSAPTVEKQLNPLLLLCSPQPAASSRLGQRKGVAGERHSLRASYQEGITWNFRDVCVSQESLYIN